MNVHGEYIHNKKMDCTTDPKSGFSRCRIECEKYFDIKKRTEDTDRKKKQVGFGSGGIENSQTGKPEKAAQCQKWWNAIKRHDISNLFASLTIGMLEYWNNGVMGFGKMENRVFGKFLLI